MRDPRALAVRVVCWAVFVAGPVGMVLLPACLDPNNGTVVAVDTLAGADAETSSSEPDVPPQSVTDVSATDAADVEATDADAADTTLSELPPPSGTCCLDDAQCADTLVCARAKTPGVCLPSPPAEGCWDDTHCPGGHRCIGATFCACGVDCALATTPGICEPVGGCCAADLPCAQGEFCALEPGETEGRCVGETLAPGSCWDSTQCDANQACLGVTLCPCGFLCGAGDLPGTCVDLPQSCCLTDDDCGLGQVCEGIGDTAGTCVDDPLGPACLGDASCCWSAADCGADAICQGASPCGCSELCDECGVCDGPAMGYCQSGDQGCCANDGDCPETWACSLPAGRCKPLPETYGQCWADVHCTGGTSCTDAWVCDCDADCDGADEPGYCVP